jgi:uncharacterized protein (DUF305 family)
LKPLLTKRWGLALLVAVAFILAACGGAGGGQQGSGSAGHGEHGKANESDGMAGMDHSNMDHGSMGMAREMVMENGRYSDKRFIDAMVPHHQGAVEMAEVALQNAKHERIKQLSRNIISSQQAEIEELKAIKKEEVGTSQVPMEMSAHEMQMMGMTDPEALADKDPFDKAFIDAMIPHHQSAISMSQVALEESENPKIKELAGNIVSAQRREIEQMLQWRQAWYPEG